MNFENGYRLRVSNLPDLTRLLAGYRVHALRLMASAYAQQVARTAVCALDAASLGLIPNPGDILKTSLDTVRSSHDRTVGGVYAPALNCTIGFYFFDAAILAVMDHGGDRYRRPWEARREVVKWGWSRSQPKPTHVGEAAWNDRARFWGEAEHIGSLRLGEFRFELVNGVLPSIGWPAVQKSLPDIDWRVEQCVKRLATAEKRDPVTIGTAHHARLSDRARAAITPEVTKESFSKRLSMNKPLVRATAVAAAQSVRKPDAKAAKEEPVDDRAAAIDHADILVAADGRPFIAVAHVGFRAEDRIFIQVGSKDVMFSQNGVQYGAVKGVAASARDYLRGLTTITLVEVAVTDRKRLLRAKHTAMVSDISLGEGLRRPTQTFKRRSRDAGMEDL